MTRLLAIIHFIIPDMWQLPCQIARPLLRGEASRIIVSFNDAEQSHGNIFSKGH